MATLKRLLLFKQGSRRGGLCTLNIHNVLFAFLICISFMLLISRNSVREIGERSVEEHIQFLPSSDNESSRWVKKPRKEFKDSILEVSNLEGFQPKKEGVDLKQPQTILRNRIKSQKNDPKTNESNKENPASDLDYEDEDKINESEEDFDLDEEFHPPTNNQMYKNVGAAFQMFFKSKTGISPNQKAYLKNAMEMLKYLDKSSSAKDEAIQISSDKLMENHHPSDHYRPADGQGSSDNTDKDKSSLLDRNIDHLADLNHQIIKIERDASDIWSSGDLKAGTSSHESDQNSMVVINKFEQVDHEDLSSGTYDTKPRPDYTSDDESHRSQPDFNSSENELAYDKPDPKVDSEGGVKSSVGMKVLLPQRIMEALNRPQRNESQNEIRTIFEIFSRRRKTSFGSSTCTNITPVGGNPEEQKFRPDETQFLCEDADFFDHFRRGCVIYSFGVKDNWAFEKATADRGCTVWVFDSNIKEKPVDVGPNINFFNYGLGTTNEVKLINNEEIQFYTLQELLKNNNHNKKVISYLKMNLNGEEWQILDQITEESSLITNNILQMGLTLRLHEALADHYLYAQYLRVLNKLFGLGFQLFTSKEVEIPDETYKEPLLDNKIVTLTNYLAFLRV